MTTEFIITNNYKTDTRNEREDLLTKIVEKLINSQVEQEMLKDTN